EDAAARVVEAEVERQAACPADPSRRLAGGAEEDAAHLRAQDELIARLAAQDAAHAVLALPQAVERRRVEVADARRPGGFQGRLRLCFRDHRQAVAQRSGAEAERGDRKASSSDLAARGEIGHFSFLEKPTVRSCSATCSLDRRCPSW